MPTKSDFFHGLLGAPKSLNRLIGLAIFGISVALGASAEIIISLGPSPAGKALRILATGSPEVKAVAEVIVEASEKRWSSPLMPRLLDVLDAYSREGESQASLVRSAFDQAQEQASSDVLRRAIAGAAETLRLRLKNQREESPGSSGWFRHDPAIPLDVPFTERSQNQWPRPVFQDRVATLIELHLSKEDRRKYVREAFRAYLASDCKSFLGGSELATCEKLGLWPLSYQAVRLAFSGLSSDGADPSIADVYLSQERDLLDAVIEQASLIHPGGFSRQCSVLRKWLHRAPTRWEIWADLEPELY